MTDRRNFLRGRLSTRAPAPRPPWAIDEAAFVATCTRCGDCARACPTRVIVQGDGGYPTIDFSRGECTFCAACVTACMANALRQEADRAPWALRAAIGDDCLARQQVECRICGDLCEPRAIRFRPRAGGISAPELAQDECTGCGACVAPCPTGAITLA